MILLCVISMSHEASTLQYTPHASGLPVEYHLRVLNIASTMHQKWKEKEEEEEEAYRGLLYQRE